MRIKFGCWCLAVNSKEPCEWHRYTHEWPITAHITVVFDDDDPQFWIIPMTDRSSKKSIVQDRT